MDLGIVIALKEEFREFMVLLPVQPAPERDPATGQYGYVFEHPVSHRRCVVTLIGEMNPEPAALQTERLLAHWSPRAVVMLGIAAGIHSDVRVGDVLIASQVDNYLATAKAQGGRTPDSFEFSLGGTVFHADYNLLTQVRNFEFFAPQVFSRWQQDCVQGLTELVPDEAVRTALLKKGLVRAAPDLLDAHLASDSVVGAAQQFTQWLRSKRDRNLKALDMESAGLMAAAVRRMEPARTLVICGISDYGDERKSDLDAVREGALRRYAMRNATRLLWSLLEAGALSETHTARTQPSPAPAQPEKHPPQRDDGEHQTPFIGIPGGSLREGFKGREQALEALHALLQETGKVALTSGTVGPVYAHGGGGMGKSRLAIEYAHRYRQEYPGGVFFAYAGERAPQAIFAEFARGLLAEKAPSREDEAALAFVRGLVDVVKGPRLIIFDDVQAGSRESLARRFSDFVSVHGQRLWPIPYAHVTLLITTRMREIEREIEGAQSFSVGRLDAEAALELLLERARPRAFSLAEHHEARRLASEELGGHPLAVKLAGAYLGRVPQLSLAEYLKRLREQGLIDKLEAAKDEVGHTIRDHEQSIAATYELSWRQLDPAKPVDALALLLLAITAYLAPGTPIDAELLQRLVRAAGMSADLEQIGRALARLATDLSLLDAVGRDVIIHPLISDYTRWRVRENHLEQEGLQHALLVGMLSLFPPSQEEFWKITRLGAHPGWEHLSGAREAHVVAVWNQTRAVESLARNALSRSLGNLYLQRGSLKRARDCYEQALEIAQRLVEKEPKNVALQREVPMTLNKLGDVLRQQGNLEGARRTCEHALEIAQRLAEKKPENVALQRDMAVSLSKLGYALRQQGNLEGARHAYEQALEIAQRLAEKQPENSGWQRDVAVSLNRLGEVLKQQGNLEGARRAYEQDLEIAQRLLEKEPENLGWQRDVSVSLSNLGDLLKQQGELEGARRTYEQALAMRQRLLEKEPGNVGWQRDVSVSFSRLGDVLIAQGNLEEARWAYEQSLDIAQLLVGKEPENLGWQRDVSMNLGRLGDVLAAQGNLEEARRAYKRALEIAQWLAEKGPKHIEWQTDFAFSQFRVATSLSQDANADRPEARSLLVQARDTLCRLAADSRLIHAQQHQWLPAIEKLLRELDG
jgi:tetratricopeptide (TPR) repeat protein/nucleoside phosphorylase